MSGTSAVRMVLLALPVVLAGCAHGVGYRIASFLFDGVPAPQAEREEPAESAAASRLPDAPGTGASEEAAPAQPASFTHAPFARGSCGSCHDGERSNRLSREGPELCTGCHPGVLTGKPVVHGVAAADCLLCHNPHRSPVARLLSKPVVEVCLDCHVRREVEQVHGQILDCTSCHNPHESDSASLLEFR